MGRARAKKPAGPRPTLSARESALGVVARRMVSEAELKERLVRRGFAAHEVDDATALVRSYKYVDDDALSEAAVREASRTGHGPFWVRQTLVRRGVSEALATRAETAAEKTARADAHNALRRRYPDGKPTSAPDRQRALRFLLSRGFSAETAAGVLGEDP